MKHIKYLLLILFLLPINIYAYEFVCPEGPFAYGNTFTCDLKGDNSQEYDALSGSLEMKHEALTCRISSYGEGLGKYTSEKTNGFSFAGKSETDTLVSFVCEVTTQLDSSLVTQLEIPDFTYHIMDSNLEVSTIPLKSGNIQIKAYEASNVTPVDTKPRKTDNPDSRLKLISDTNLDFTFTQFKTEYNLEVLFEVDHLDLHVVPVNENATVKIDGDQNLKIGENVIDIYVTSPDETSITCYTLKVKRLKRGEEIYYPEKDASLKNLIISNYPINFESIVYDYNIHLAYDVEHITINAVPTVDEASIDISDTDRLKDGDAVAITVTSKDGSNKMKYLIHITKDQPPKDYKGYIFAGVIVILIAVIIVVIVKTNKKNQNDPLLRLRGDKTKINYGEKLDVNKVPDAGSGVNTEGAINTIDLTNTAKPIETEEVLDLNRNQTVSVVTTLDLSNAKLPNGEEVLETIEPTEVLPPKQPVVQQQPVQPVVQQQPVQPVQPVVQQQPVQPQVIDMTNVSVPPPPVNPEPVVIPVQEEKKEEVVEKVKEEIPPIQQTVPDNPNVIRHEPEKESNIFD